MNLTPQFKILNQDQIPEIASLGVHLNPKFSEDQLQIYLKQMFQMPTYHCFGIYIGDKLIGISSGWITVRFYSGKQLEVDNVLIDKEYQSKGLGKLFFEYIEQWAKENECKTVELNTYVRNIGSHKFYYNLSYSILGFHFWKELK